MKSFRCKLVLSLGIAALSVTAAAQVAGLPEDTAVTGGAPVAEAPVAPLPEVGFAAWVADYAVAARARGLDPVTIASTTASLRYVPRAIALDRAQPDDSARAPTVFADYLARRLEPVRIGRGRTTRDTWRAQLAAIEAQSGVPARIVLGIWGMESSYGAVTGDFDVPSAVASLAFDGRRRDLFTRELDAAIAILAAGRASREQLRGSWAGAMGQPQFLPSSYLAFAADGDGDGRADIWESPLDVAASIANYLKHNGWQAGQDWGLPVVVPGAVDREALRATEAPTQCIKPLSRHSRWLPINQWRALGLIVANGKPWPADTTPATLIEPDGPGGRAYLTFANYRTILSYNCSNYYALSVALLGDALE